MTRTRKFSVHPSIIFDLVTGQAGSLAKAVLECIMNSIDAGATRITIEIDALRIRLSDDGRGFRSRREIEDWFEVFGFPHQEGDRVYGKFGIGRAQLWAFCSTVWRTHTFEMTVDIKKSGLDYGLNEDLPAVPGVTIEGTFYEALLPSDVGAFEKELADLARYAQIPVILNGKQINKDPAKEKWDHVTDDAYIRLTEGHQLAVYNLGVLVKRFPSYIVGAGGVVVTKPGVKLALNMARNDILVSQCAVWKRLKPLLQGKADARMKTKPTRLSEAELENLAQRFLSRELAYEDVKEVKLITDIIGRGFTLKAFDRAVGAWFGRDGRVVTVAEAGSRIGETAHQRKLAFVFSPLTLARFEAESVKGLLAKLHKVLKASQEERLLEGIRTEESIQKAVPALADGYTVLKDADLSASEKAALRALNRVSREVVLALMDSGAVIQQRPQKHQWQSADECAVREVRAGISDVAKAWTDGRNYIVYSRESLKLFGRGIGGTVGLLNIMVHEYLHDQADTGSHTHDLEFYHRYHEATCGEAAIMKDAASKALDMYVRELTRLNKKANAKLLEGADVIAKAHRLQAD